VVLTHAAQSSGVFSSLVVDQMWLHALMALASETALRVELALRWELDRGVTDYLEHSGVTAMLDGPVRAGRGDISVLVVHRHGIHAVLYSSTSL
jgi:predicted short-subunit dehydrogenase-like oxidoreductase (DUF2520 family)